MFFVTSRVIFIQCERQVQLYSGIRDTAIVFLTISWVCKTAMKATSAEVWVRTQINASQCPALMDPAEMAHLTSN